MSPVRLTLVGVLVGGTLGLFASLIGFTRAPLLLGIAAGLTLYAIDRARRRPDA